MYLYLLWSTLIPRDSKNKWVHRGAYNMQVGDRLRCQLVWFGDVVGFKTCFGISIGRRRFCSQGPSDSHPKYACRGFRETWIAVALLWRANLMSVAWPWALISSFAHSPQHLNFSRCCSCPIFTTYGCVWTFVVFKFLCLLQCCHALMCVLYCTGNVSILILMCRCVSFATTLISAQNNWPLCGRGGCSWSTVHEKNVFAVLHMDSECYFHEAYLCRNQIGCHRFAYIFDSVHIIWSGSLVFVLTATRDLGRKIRLVCCLGTFLSQLHWISWKWVGLFGVEEDVCSLVHCIWQDGIRNCAHGKQMSSPWSIVMEDVYRISSFCLQIWLCLHHLKQICSLNLQCDEWEGLQSCAASWWTPLPSNA